MSETVATTKRVVLQFSAHHVDVMVPAGLRLSDALRSVGVDPGDPTVLVVASDGTPVDTARTAAETLEDGAVLHISARPTGPRPRPTTRAGAAGEAPPLLPQVVLMVLAGVCALVVTLASVLAPLESQDLLTPLQQGVVAGAFLAAALGLALRPRVYQDGRNEVCLVVAAFLACAGGASAIDASVAQSHQLALATGFICAGAVSAIGAVTARRTGGDGLQMALVLASVFAVSALLALAALFLGLGAWTFAAILLGLVPPALRALPAWSLQVPDIYLVDAEHVTRAALSVRGAPPQPTPALRNSVVQAAVRRGDRLLASGIVTLSVTSVLAAPVVLLGAPASGLQHVAAGVLLTLVAVALVSIPRSARNLTTKTVPRMAAGFLLLALVASVISDGSTHLLTLAAGAIVVGIALGYVAVPVARGRRSVMLSRFTDSVEALAVAFALPAALVTVGAIELIRTAFSR